MPHLCSFAPVGSAGRCDETVDNRKKKRKKKKKKEATALAVFLATRRRFGSSFPLLIFSLLFLCFVFAMLREQAASGR